MSRVARKREVESLLVVLRCGRPGCGRDHAGVICDPGLPDVFGVGWRKRIRPHCSHVGMVDVDWDTVQRLALKALDDRIDRAPRPYVIHLDLERRAQHSATMADRPAIERHAAPEWIPRNGPVPEGRFLTR